jgi:hypothetical protein
MSTRTSITSATAATNGMIGHRLTVRAAADRAARDPPPATSPSFAVVTCEARHPGLAAIRLTRRSGAHPTDAATEVCFVRRDCESVPMRGELARTLEEVRLQLELDQERGVTPLPVRARALQDARAARDRAAERQALIDLAAACVAAAAKLPPPRKALAEIQARPGAGARASKKLATRRAA